MKCLKCGGPYKYKNERVFDNFYCGPVGWKIKLFDKMISSKKTKKLKPKYKIVDASQLCYDCFCNEHYDYKKDKGD